MKATLDLLLSDSFAEYRKAEMEAAAGFIKARLWDQDMNPDYLRGALDLLRQVIVKLPAGYAVNDDQKAAFSMIIARDTETVIAEILRQTVRSVVEE